MTRGTCRPARPRPVSPARAFLLHPLLLALCLGAAACGESSGTDAPPFPPGPEDRIPLPDLRPAQPYEVVHEKGVRIVRETDPAQASLYADVYRPAAGGRFPALLQAIAYRREFLGLAGMPFELAANGYAVILLDCRGTGSSEGVWGSFSDEELEDVAWIVDRWIPQQPWSDGKVGLFGPSYMGIIQLLTAARRPAHLKAIFPGVSMADAYRDIFYQGGIFDQEFILFWAVATAGLSLLPSTELFRDPYSALKAFVEHAGNIPSLLQWLEMTTDQAFFEERSPMYFWDALAQVPVFMTGGWFCIFTRGSLLNYANLEEKARALPLGGPGRGSAAPRKILVGPWYHMFGAFLEGVPSEDLHRRWFDWHLKADQDPLYARYDILDPRYPVSLYVMGAERWRKEASWPLDRARYASLYLSGQRQAADKNESLNNGTLFWEEERPGRADAAGADAVTRIRHDPPAYAGLESRATARWLVGITGFLPSAEDERENEKRTLTFSTAPLERDLEVTGPAVLRFWARTRFGPLSPESRRTLSGLRSASGPGLARAADRAEQNDVHWIVNLNDVFPDGRSRNLTSGWLAASHRRDPRRPDWTQAGYDPFLYPEDRDPVQPEDGEVYEYVVEIWPTCNLFRAGHQIRIDIANSDVPHLLPTLVPSESEILHDADHPSRLVLPVVDPAATDEGLWIQDPEAYFQGRAPW